MAERIDEDVKQRSPASARREPWGSACGVKSMRKVHITGFSRFPHRRSCGRKRGSSEAASDGKNTSERSHRGSRGEGRKEATPHGRVRPHRLWRCFPRVCRSAQQLLTQTTQPRERSRKESKPSRSSARKTLTLGEVVSGRPFQGSSGQCHTESSQSAMRRRGSPGTSGFRSSLIIWGAVLLRTCSAFYLPGVAPVDFQKGEQVTVKANSLTSPKTALPVEYYDLPVCRPSVVHSRAENLGEVLRGDRIYSSPYSVEMRNEKLCQVSQCLKNASHESHVPWLLYLHVQIAIISFTDEQVFHFLLRPMLALGTLSGDDPRRPHWSVIQMVSLLASFYKQLFLAL